MEKPKIILRELSPKLEKWLNRREIFAIKGPRQSGKTTLLKLLGEKLAGSGKVIFLNFEDPDKLEALRGIQRGTSGASSQEARGTTF